MLLIYFTTSFDYISKSYECFYKNLQNFFPDIGGIFSSLFLIGKILIDKINEKKLHYDAINNIFRAEMNVTLNNNNLLVRKKENIKSRNKDLILENQYVFKINPQKTLKLEEKIKKCLIKI